MATVTVRRAQAFKRGNASIQILLDGKTAATILRDEEVSVSASEGSHTIQAVMHGMKGPKLKVQLTDAETIHLTISGATIPRYSTLESLLFLLVLLLPSWLGIDTYFWLIMAFYAAIAIFLVVRMRARTHQMLIIQRAEESGITDLPVAAAS